MGLSVSHLIIIFLILLLLFGAQRLEGIGSSLGKAIRGFKKGIDGEEEAKKAADAAEAAALQSKNDANQPPKT